MKEGEPGFPWCTLVSFVVNRFGRPDVSRLGWNQPKWAAITFGVSCILNWTLWMIRPREWDYNQLGVLKRADEFGC
jgi:hypothetical protein